ncbi:MAG: MG2 domain-containing protein [Acidobacteria bacterium]|nr:MG2 domain-containing protein [Acidobacteriota bacterium]
MKRTFLLCVLGLVVLTAGPSWAQDAADDQSPAFNLWSSQIFTTAERPAFSLTYRSLDHLDFRVYRVSDPQAFFASLKDPHQLGSEKPVVPQEQTWLERIANWKAEHRFALRDFLRRQVSYQYRVQRREQQDKEKVTQRQTLQYNTFAQVPLLNAAGLVASWREILPPVRDAETRRIPLDVKEPGIYVVEAVSAPLKAYTIVMVSDIGLVTKTAPGQILVYATNRMSGEPQKGCDIQTLINGKSIGSSKTGDDGVVMATFETDRPESVISVGRCGSQVTATDPGSWSLSDARRELVGYIYTDKPIYRPGHTVRLKGVLRWRAGGQLTVFDGKQIEVSIADGNDKVLFRETRPVDAFGSVSAAFTLPAGASLGYYAITMTSADEKANGSFEVQEYRKPEFEVTVASPDRFVVQGAKVQATITARYYFGQPVAGGSVTYVVHRQAYYSPLRWNDDSEEEGGGWWGGGEEASEETVRLNDQGTATVSIPTDPAENRRDYSIRIEARVTDASNREVSGHTLAHCTYGTYMVTADTDRYVQKPGGAVQVSAKAMDYLGVPQPNLTLRAVLESVIYTEGRWSEPTYKPIANGAMTTDADGRGSWSLTLPKEPGSYRFRVSGDSGGREVEDTAHVWVTGAASDVTDESDTYLELIADQASYKPGDTARLVVRGGAVTAPVLVTKEGKSISYYRVGRPGGDGSLEVPITEQDFGDIYVNIVFVKNDRLYRAEKRLKVPAAPRQLRVAVTATQTVAKPRQTGAFTLAVTDAEGKPVKAQLSVGVIDEAVYGVKPDDTVDPLRFFYRLNYSRVYTDFSRDYSFVGYAGTQQLRLAQRRRPLTLADFKGERQGRPQVRKEFPDAIYWVADLATDAQGMATVDVPYPDALTTWRLTARAVTADTKVGTGLARTTTTKDLILRVVTPRFLTEGDTLNLPVIVHNYLPSDKSVTVSGKVTGLQAVDAADQSIDLGQARTVQVAQGGESRIEWRLKAPTVGTAVVTGTATTEGDSDAVELPFPVLPFGLKKEAGQAGSMVGAGEQTSELRVPETSNPAARTIRVQVAPSLGGPVLGALDFLTSYPYGCTEQTLSSFVPNLAAKRTLTDLKIPLTEGLKSLDRQVTEGLTRLYDYQHEDGGWGWWKTDENHPFMTAYAIAGLLEAKAGGYKVEDFRVSNGVRALRKMYVEYPRAIPELKAYETYVLVRALASGVESYGGGDDEKLWEQKAALDELWSARSKMTPYGTSLLLLALDAAKDPRGATLAGELASAVERKGDLAWWTTDRDPLLFDFVDTSVEATALAVQALAARDPKNPLIEPAIRWLLLNRTFGTYWSSTKQTAMVLYSLLDVMKARQESPADAEVEVFVNGTSTGVRKFTAASMTAPDPIEITAPAKPGANTIRFVKRGGGALYWATQAVYFDTQAAQERTGSHKLALQRQYFTLKPVTVKNRIVYRETPLQGSVQPGDLLLVRLTTAGSTDWRYLMLEDPIPAGTEPIQRDDLYTLEKGKTDWWGSRREYRDSRVVFFQEDFEAGRYDYTYLLKVIAPGVFRASPARISAMYVPDGSASSAAATITVESAATPAGAAQSKGGQQ